MSNPSTTASPIVPWPRSAPSADELIRYSICRGLWCYAASWRAIDDGAFDDRDSEAASRYSLLTHQMIHNHDTVVSLKAMQQVDPRLADDLAARLWTAADAGDSYGEWLWQWAEEAGLDAEAIHQAGTNSAPPRTEETP